MRLILLSGTPGSGKDTLSDIASSQCNHALHFKKVRDSHGGFGKHFEIIDPEKFDAFVEKGDFLQWHGRYGRRYGVLKSEIENLYRNSTYPIIHVGKYENRSAFEDSDYNTVSILLWCERAETKKRLNARHANDAKEVDRRLGAYDEEVRDLLREKNAPTFNYFLNTGDKTITTTGKEFLRIIGKAASECDPPEARTARMFLHNE